MNFFKNNKILSIIIFILFLFPFSSVGAISYLPPEADPSYIPGWDNTPNSWGEISVPSAADLHTQDNAESEAQNQLNTQEIKSKMCSALSGICKTEDERLDYETEAFPEIPCTNGQKCWVEECFLHEGTCELSCSGNTTPSNYKCKDPGRVCCKRSISETPATSSPISFTPEYGIPGFKDKVDVSGALYGDFLKALFKYLIYLSGVFAVIIIIVSGFQWVLAAGNQSKIEGAKSRLKNALIGFVLCSSSVLILSTINLDLINIRPLKIEGIIPIEVLADTSEPFDEQDIASYNFSGVTYSDAKASGIHKIPVINGVCSNDQRSTQTTIDALKIAAQCMVRKGYVISLASSYRTVQRQSELYRQNCKSSTCGASCSPPTCCPFGGKICPHTSGMAFDAYGRKTCGGPKTKAGQKALQDCMFEAGFCLLASECWHFELPKMSRSCSMTNNYNRCGF